MPMDFSYVNATLPFGPHRQFLCHVYLEVESCIFFMMTCCLPARRKTKVEDIPADLVSWQVASMRDVFVDEKITPKDVRKYTFGWLREGDMVGYRKPGAADVSFTGLGRVDLVANIVDDRISDTGNRRFRC